MSRRFLFLVAATALLGCQKIGLGGKSSTIQKGSSVKIHYTLTVGGTVVDSSSGGEPLSYVQGSGQIIPGLEAALGGLGVGDKKTVTVPPEKGYGLPDSKALQKVPKKSFQNVAGLKVGSPVRGQAGGKNFQAGVVAIGKEDITLDFNHPLAGKTLNFDIEVMEVRPGS